MNPRSVGQADPRAPRTRHLRDVGVALWPDPLITLIDRRRPAAHGRPDLLSEFVIVPSAKRARVIVPIAPRAAAAAAVQRYAEPGTRIARMRTALLAAAFSTGVGPMIMRDRFLVCRPPAGPDTSVNTADSLATHLRTVLGSELLLGMHVSRPRANRKPVLQLLTPTGTTRAFVKVGLDPFTTGLVRHETGALGRVAAASLRHSTAPEVLHAGSWRGLEILVVSALPVWERRVSLDPARLSRAVSEIADIAGRDAAELTTGRYWQVLRTRTESLPGASRAAVRAVLDRMQATCGHRRVVFGSWHGDFAPWNIAARSGELLVWDWERFDVGVPLGFDALHFRLQPRLLRPNSLGRRLPAHLVHAAADALRPLGVGRADAPVILAAYLLEISVRYLEDAERATGNVTRLTGQLLAAAGDAISEAARVGSTR